MNIIVVVDDGGGMLFNGRRQSLDRVLRDAILKIAAGGCLWMNAYSYGQFGGGTANNIRVDEKFLDKAGADDFCFIENLPLAAYEYGINAIWLFRWNRSYPADFFFDIDVADGKWNLRESRDFKGYSHEKITLEVYGHEK